MIVRMKELVVFTLASAADDSVRQLGHLGVVDIKEMDQPVSVSISEYQSAISRTERAIALLQSRGNKQQVVASGGVRTPQSPEQIAKRIVASVKLKQKGQQALDQLKEQLQWYETWGEGKQLSELNILADKGVHLRLYEANRETLEALSGKHCIVRLPERDGKIPVVLIAQHQSELLDLPEVIIPELSRQAVMQRIERKQRQLAKVDQYVDDQLAYTPVLREHLLQLKDRLTYERALASMEDIGGKLKFLQGYLPKEAVDSFLKLAQKNNWGYQIAEPEHPEEVPVYVRNPKWVEIINPMMRFIDIVPGYLEVDVSIYFLVAFALFFAMLVGDAGYGFLFLVITFLFRKKMPTQLRWLSYVLSGSTLIWGVLSGTYFGAEQIAAIPFFNGLIIEQIASFGVENSAFMMHLSFLIGAIHLTVAHGIRLIQFLNSMRALSELGWIALMWGLYFLTESLVLGNDFPQWASWLFVGGTVLVALFSVESKSFFRSLLVSISNLPLSLISGFSDIVSYVRLFAVGMATVTVASSFNNMIIPEGMTGLSILELLIAAVALLLGHSLNIALALMAVLVHGVRLNMLEFAGHLGVQFSGEAYRPLQLMASADLPNDWPGTSIATKEPS